MDYRRTRHAPTEAQQRPHTEPPPAAATGATPAPPRRRIPTPKPARPTVPMVPPSTLASAARPTPELGVPNHPYSLSLQQKPYDYTTPPVLDALAVDLTLSEEETERLKTAQQIVTLCKSWLRRPVFDLEYTPGYERYIDELIMWHDEQLRRKAQILGCSMRMIINLEELVRCFIEERPPRDMPLASRLLHEY